MKSKGIWVNGDIIRKILKTKLNFSFKRWSPRPLTLNHKIVKLRKALFTVKQLKIINGASLLVNIDEVVFSQSTKTNYSWSRKDMPSNLSTQIIKESVSIISSIASNGMSITGVRKGTIISSSFIEYMKHMTTALKRI